MTQIPYTKPPLTCEQQADRLLERGLNVPERQHLVDLLRRISYYRLSAYLYPFKIVGTDEFKQGTTLDAIYRRYRFDRRFRLLILDALERVETAMKARIVNIFVLKHGAFGYTDRNNFYEFDDKNFNKFQSEIGHVVEKSREMFVEHYRKHYSNPELPLWMVAELISFGTMYTMFRHMNRSEQMEVAQYFSIPLKILESWLLTLNYVRNICAHHARLWNKRLGIAPKVPTGRGFEAWSSFNNEKVFFLLLMLSHLLKACAPNTDWRGRVESLLSEYSDLPLERIGFFPGWNKHAIWLSNPAGGVQ